MIISITKNKMEWKQPIPTGFISNSNLTVLEKMLFSYLWSMTHNSDGKETRRNGKKIVSIEFKKGQVYVNISELSRELEIGEKKIRKSIENIGKWHTKMETTAISCGLLITWVSYDDMIKMESKTETTGKPQGNHGEKHKQECKKGEKGKDNKIGFDLFWSEFPQARQGKKAEAKKYYENSLLSEKEISEELQLYKLKIKHGMQDIKFVPACQRWIRDIVKTNDMIKQEVIYSIICKIMTLPIEARASDIQELISMFGEGTIRELSDKRKKNNNKGIVLQLTK